MLFHITHLWAGYILLATVGVPSTAIIIISPVATAAVLALFLKVPPRPLAEASG